MQLFAIVNAHGHAEIVQRLRQRQPLQPGTSGLSWIRFPYLPRQLGDEFVPRTRMQQILAKISDRRVVSAQQGENTDQRARHPDSPGFEVVTQDLTSGSRLGGMGDIPPTCGCIRVRLIRDDAPGQDLCLLRVQDMRRGDTGHAAGQLLTGFPMTVLVSQFQSAQRFSCVRLPCKDLEVTVEHSPPDRPVTSLASDPVEQIDQVTGLDRIPLHRRQKTLEAVIRPQSLDEYREQPPTGMAIAAKHTSSLFEFGCILQIDAAKAVNRDLLFFQDESQSLQPCLASCKSVLA